jgi:hypothetical protein
VKCNPGIFNNNVFNTGAFSSMGVFNAGVFNSNVFNTGEEAEVELIGRKYPRRLRRRGKYGRKYHEEILDPQIQELAQEAASKLQEAGQELVLAKRELSIARAALQQAEDRTAKLAVLKERVAGIEEQLQKLRREEEFIYLIALAV